jgi:hypothetical protein
MILRDAIFAEITPGKKEKSAIGRVFTNLTNKIMNTGEPKGQKPALINSLASRGKEKILEFADGLPIYRSIRKDDHNKTVFAVGDNLSIGLKKRNIKNESSLPENR